MDWRSLIDENGHAVIPNRVTEIDKSAFNGCNNLTSIEIPDSVTEIGSGAFSGCTGLTSIDVSSDNPCFKSEENCCVTKDGQQLIVGCKTSIIPDSMTVIGDYAFSGCTGLTNITIPDSVTKIRHNAFCGCTGLTNISMHTRKENPEAAAGTINAVLSAFGNDKVTLYVPIGTGYAYRHYPFFFRHLKEIIIEK